MTPEQFDAIIADVTIGLPVGKSADEHGVHRMAFYKALDADPALAERYARAKSAALEAMANDILEISDGDGDHNRARLRVDTRKWLLSKLAPKKYGDKLDVDLKGKLTVTLNQDDVGLI